jgi:hypothetical protein
MRVIYESIIEHLRGRILRNPPIQMPAVVLVDCVAVREQQFPIRRVGFLRRQVPLTLIVPPPSCNVGFPLGRTLRAVVVAVLLLDSLVHWVGWISFSPAVLRNRCVVLVGRWCIYSVTIVGGFILWLSCRRVGRGWIRLVDGCIAGRLLCVRGLL